MKTDKRTKYNYAQYIKMKRYTRDNKKCMQGQVVMIGDSIIDLYPTFKYYEDKKSKVYNRGISGDTTDKMLKRLYDNALVLEPKTIFVLIGTNDISRGLSHDETMANMEKILSSIKATNVENIYVESVYPVNRNMDKLMVGIRTNELVLALNERIKSLCEKMGIHYLDIYSHLLDDKGQLDKDLSIDGLHPNLKGYDIITELLTQYID